MSSMGLKTNISYALMASSALAIPVAAHAQTPTSWPDGSNTMVAQQPTQAASAINRWEYLTKADNLSFADYAGFITSYPNFPKQELLQLRAEKKRLLSALEHEVWPYWESYRRRSTYWHARKRDVTPQMRAILIDWLVEVAP